MKKKILVIYVAGPFRAKAIPGQTQPNQWEQEQNIRRAEAIALDLWRKGFAAVCPHTNTRYYQGACADEVWLEGDLAILEKCDGVLLTPDWKNSQGATKEREHALMMGIPVDSDLDQLIGEIELNAKESREAGPFVTNALKELANGIALDNDLMRHETASFKETIKDLRNQLAKKEDQLDALRIERDRLQEHLSPKADPLYGNPR